MNVLSCSKCFPPIKSIYLHSHPCWELILQTSGHTTTTIEGKNYELSKGDILILPPKTIHKSKSDMLYTDIAIQCDNMDFSDVTVLHDHDDSVLTLANMLYNVYISMDTDYKIIANSLLDAIVTYLKKYNHCEYRYKCVSDLKAEICTNISNREFSINDAIAKMGFHPDYVRRCFRAEINMTPLEYQTNVRLAYAKKTLVHEPYTNISEVAEKCGYSDSFYFSRIFKKHIGLSPMQYRKQHM